MQEKKANGGVMVFGVSTSAPECCRLVSNRIADEAEQATGKQHSASDTGELHNRLSEQIKEPTLGAALR